MQVRLALIHGHMHDLREMDAIDSGSLGYLGSAGEAVRKDDGVLGGCADNRKQFLLTKCLGDIKVAWFEAPVSCQSPATAANDGGIDTKRVDLGG